MNEQEYLDRLQQLWEKNWPSHLPKESRYPFGEVLLTEYLQRWAQKNPDKPSIIYYGAEVTFKQLDDLSSQFAAFLSSLGYTKGDRVAVMIPNCPQFLIVFFGILKLGCVHVPVNPMFKEHELLYELNDTEARLIVVLDQLFPLVQSVKEQTSLEHAVITRFSDYLPDNPTFPIHETLQAPPVDCPGTLDLVTELARQGTTYPDNSVQLDDVVAFNYTGGTTGMPKGCEHTQRDMIYTAATSVTFLSELTDADVGMNYLPIFWIAGEDMGVIFPIFSGATFILLGRWDPLAAMAAIQRYKITRFGGVLDNIVELMEHPDVGNYDLSSVQMPTVSSFIKKMNTDYREKWKKLAGGIMREAAYGMTETHTCDTFTNGLQTDDLDLKSKPVFCGLPMPGTLFKILDFETRELVPLGQEGEIMVKSPSLLKSYWNKPEATERDLQDGWLSTGDIGMLDEEGFLHFLGRRKEMLKVRGMSVFPSEIEVILGRHPAIHGSGVTGQSDPEKGQIPVAYIQLKPEYQGKITPEELRSWCRDNMATYKVPVVKFIKDLPLTATGKVIKEELGKD